MIADPLKLSDCSLITDGAAAVVLAADDMAGEFTRPVRFRAAAHVSDVLPLSAKDLASFEGPTRAIAAAYAQAGGGVNDLSLAEVHDCFTIAELLTIEAPGKGRAAVIAGETTREGRLPGADLAMAVNMGGGAVATYATILERVK
jgi:acetyl-CoA C-acetyltransferase